jgi:GNAT superfamily N-acetyltransferase
MELDLSFREAVAADLSAILALLRDDTLGKDREDGAQDRYASAFARIIANPNAVILLAERQGRVVACAQIDFLENLSLRATLRANIEGVRVASDLRGGGFGQTFFGHIEKYCRTQCCGLMQLTMNAARIDAARFYQSIGFEPTHTGFKKPL